MKNYSLRTVEWKNNKVVMIDQTKLPNELVFVEYDDFNQVADAIRTLVVRGAPAIGVSGAFGLALAVLQSDATTKDELLSDLLTSVTLAVQSLDPTTLDIIKRANIKFLSLTYHQNNYVILYKLNFPNHKKCIDKDNLY